MIKKTKRGLCFVLSFPALYQSKQLKALENCLGHPFINNFSEENPLYWHLPALFLSSTGSPINKELSDQLLKKLGQGNNRFLPAGYSAAPHPFLFEKELEYEISLVSRILERQKIDKNPEKNTIFCLNADLVRAFASQIYKTKTNNFIYPLTQPDKNNFLWLAKLNQEGSPQFLPALYITDNSFEILKIKSFLRVYPSLIIILTADFLLKGLTLLSENLKKLQIPTKTEILSLDKIDEPKKQFKRASEMAPFLATAYPEYWFGNTVLADFRQNQAVYSAKESETLILWQRRPEIPVLKENIISAKDPKLLGSMQQSRLIEHGVILKFDRGRLNSIRFQEDDSLWHCRPSSYLIVDKGRFPFQRTTSFAISSDYTWGLRESRFLQMDPQQQPGLLKQDYLFCEEAPFLLLSTSISFPCIPADYVKSFAPLEIPLLNCSKKEEIEIKGLLQDGSGFSFSTSCANKSFILPGSSFLIRNSRQSRLIAFPFNHKFLQTQMAFQIRKTGKYWQIFANPFGSYTQSPVRELSSSVLEFSVALSVEKNPELKPLELPEIVKTHIASVRVYRLSSFQSNSPL